MPYDEDQIANLEAEVDDLVTPTTEDVLAYSQDYDVGIVAASALQKSLNGGGGGGGSFNGGTITEPLIITPSDALDYSLTVSSLQDGGAALMVPWYADLGLGNDAHKFDNYGTWYGQSALLLGQVGDAAASVLLTLQSSVDTTAFITATDGSNEMFTVGPTGAVTISPPDTSASTPLTVKGGTDAGVNFDTLVNIKDDADQYVFQVDAAGDMYVNLRQDGAEFVVSGNTSNLIHATRDGADDKLGFFGVAAVAQQSVAVGINEIHAALVNLGLIVEAP